MAGRPGAGQDCLSGEHKPACSPAPDIHAQLTRGRRGALRSTVDDEQEIAESQCMRKHGVPSMPLPNAQGQIVFPAGAPDPSQPQFQAAEKHCAYLNP
jgi:hypothetical protein